MPSRWLLLVPAAVVIGCPFVGMVERHDRAHAVPELVVAGQAEPSGLALRAAARTTPYALHYAPAENLEKIDVALIDDAVRTIDVAAYVLTDFPVIEALTRAAGRGVTVRILLDREQFGRQRERGLSAPFRTLQVTPGVTIRVKTTNVYMHLKAYQIDGRTLRTGSANLSASGLKQQDNDLVVLDSAAAAARFLEAFEPAFAAGAAE